MSEFRFKRFTVRQDATPMKVGTDGVLLGAWVSVAPDVRQILDIGTGTGLIALMLAQRAPQARVVGIDIGEVDEARANAEASPWADRLDMFRCPVQSFAPPARFDLIVSNPPFFVDSLPCPDAGRAAARHAACLPFPELRDAAVRLLAPGGRFAVILPAEAATSFIALCCGPLVLARRTDVRTTPRRPARRSLLEFVAAGPTDVPLPHCSELTVGTGIPETYTPEYRALTRDFYLKF